MPALLEKVKPPAAFWAGAVAILSQTLLFRELSNILRSNELILGLILSAWMIFAGVGALLRPPRLRPSTALFALLFFSAVSMGWLALLAVSLFPGVGQVWPFSRVILLVALAVAPQSFLVGAVFSCLSGMRRPGPDSTHTYIFEGLGSFAGGIVSLAISASLRPDIALPVFSALAVVSLDRREIELPSKSLIMLAAAGMIAISPSLVLLDSIAYAKTRGADSIERYESRLGAIEVSQRESETEVFRGGIYLGNAGDSLSIQDILHPLMVTCKPAPKVAVLGGILQGSARIVGQYDPESTFVLIDDERFLQIACASFRNFRMLDHDRIRVVFGEPRRALRKLPDQLDLIFIYSSLPSSVTEGKISTERAFSELSGKLSSNGRIAVGVPVSPNYLNPEESAFLSGLLGAARGTFPDAQIYIVENHALLVAPDGGEFGRRLSSGDFAEPRSNQINSAMISMSVEPFRQSELMRRLSENPSPPNSDSRPIAYLIGLRLWERLAGGFIVGTLSKIGFSAVVIIVAVILALALVAKLLFRAEQAFTSASVAALGFFGMGLGILILYAFQVAVGRLYTAMGLLSSMFILGSVLGARLFSKPSMKAGVWRFIALPIPPAIFILLKVGGSAPSTALAIVIFGTAMSAVGFLCGSFYSLSLRLAFFSGFWGKSAPAKAYSFDLLGASAASSIVGVVFIPIFGLERTLLILIFFIILALISVSKKMNFQRET